jgi:hypothetical protein
MGKGRVGIVSTAKHFSPHGAGTAMLAVAVFFDMTTIASSHQTVWVCAIGVTSSFL